jgi:hypothetical protein
LAAGRQKGAGHFHGNRLSPEAITVASRVRSLLIGKQFRLVRRSATGKEGGKEKEDGCRFACHWLI